MGKPRMLVKHLIKEGPKSLKGTQAVIICSAIRPRPANLGYAGWPRSALIVVLWGSGWSPTPMLAITPLESGMRSAAPRGFCSSSQ